MIRWANDKINVTFINYQYRTYWCGFTLAA